MWLRCLGFALLVGFPGVLYAVGVSNPCSPPILKNGYFLPPRESYPDGTNITYSCDTGYKPIVEGWWARSMCENGEWLEEPQCVEETACLPPAIPNGKYIQSSTHWYKDGSTLQINCNDGYSLKSQNDTMQCTRGTWSSLLVCQKHPRACVVPPNVPNAVIIHKKYKELFAEFEKVEYMCKAGYLAQDRNPKRIVTCVSGNWNEGPICTLSTSPEPKRPEPATVSIDNCGEFPDVLNGVMVRQSERSLTYECQMYYKLVGSGTVVCHSGGSWSAVPTCKEDYCVLKAGVHPKFTVTANVYFNNGEAKELKCVGNFWATNYSVVRCIDGKLIASECCNRFQWNTGLC
ncbi:coagulation factor XIII B chain [Fundulus heteroclitus]|uniref:coagulation factor XIII B chain n=1 Tax=Fundulus heteroclitus TaxID=8078 RepID=UPI00165CB0FF|nr:coagulation factor XIII B chain [Fundulus heteroclitus]